MNDHDIHTPSPEFRDYLEDRVVCAFRQDRRSRYLRVLGVVVLSLALGSTAGIATAQIGDGARRDSLVEAASAELSLAGLRLNLARAAATDAADKVKLGLLAPTAVTDAEADLRAAEAQTLRAQANLEEIRASSQPPRNELNAPLVGDRDFVLARITYELVGAQQRLTSAERAMDEIARRVRIGTEPELAQLAAQVEVARARAALGVLAMRHELRQQWVSDKQTPADVLVRRMHETELRFDAMVAAEALKLAQARLAFVQQRHAVGQAEQVELLKAELEMRERQMELQQIARQLERVGRTGGVR